MRAEPYACSADRATTTGWRGSNQPARRVDEKAVDERIPVGISSCLLGQAVRFDGGHKHDRYITEVLGRHFEYVAFCPEVAIGLGVPRPPIHLVDETGSVRVLGVEDPALDVTAALADYADEVSERIDAVCGYIFKRDSPSCGMQGVEVHSRSGQVAGTASGGFAHRLMQRLPFLPCEEEGRLRDWHLRENFITRVFTLHRWRALEAKGLEARDLVDFHTQQKALMGARDESLDHDFDRVVAGADRSEPGALAARYITRLMEALRRSHLDRTDRI